MHLGTYMKWTNLVMTQLLNLSQGKVDKHEYSFIWELSEFASPGRKFQIQIAAVVNFVEIHKREIILILKKFF